MGMSASQARFLELTARKSNIEYQAQRINFERLQLSQQSADASKKYNDAISNTKLVFSYNTGKDVQKVDITYNNYKNYINQQLEGLESTQQKLFLVSTSGNKIIVSDENDMRDIINQNLDPETQLPIFNVDDFMVTPDLDKVENFQQAIKDGIYYFATYGTPEGEEKPRFTTLEWDTLGAGAISEEYDKTDDAKAQAEYDQEKAKIQKIDKKLELQLDQLNSEREAITTEMESVKKVIEDNIESTYKVFG